MSPRTEPPTTHRRGSHDEDWEATVLTIIGGSQDRSDLVYLR